MSNQKRFQFKICKKFGSSVYPFMRLNFKQQLKLKKIKKNMKKRSNFASQLQARQLISYLYGRINSVYLYTLFQKSFKTKGKVGNNFLSLLERRLDTTLFKLHFSSTFSSARQLINHKKILVNSKTITRPSYILQPGDVISIQDTLKASVATNIKRFVQYQEQLGTLRKREKQSSNLKPIMEKAFWYKPLNVEVNYKTLQIIFLFSPQQTYFPTHIDLNLVTKAFQK